MYSKKLFRVYYDVLYDDEDIMDIVITSQNNKNRI